MKAQCIVERHQLWRREAGVPPPKCAMGEAPALERPWPSLLLCTGTMAGIILFVLGGGSMPLKIR